MRETAKLSPKWNEGQSKPERTDPANACNVDVGFRKHIRVDAMNMNFQNMHGAVDCHLAGNPVKLNGFEEQKSSKSTSPLRRWLFWTVGAGAAAYIVLNASPKILLTIAGVVVLAVGGATAVCVYALNNTR